MGGRGEYWRGERGGEGRKLEILNWEIRVCVCVRVEGLCVSYERLSLVELGCLGMF